MAISSFDEDLKILSQKKNVVYTSGSITPSTTSSIHWQSGAVPNTITCPECFAEVKSNFVKMHYNYHRDMNDVLEQLIMRVVNKRG